MYLLVSLMMSQSSLERVSRILCSSSTSSGRIMLTSVKLYSERQAIFTDNYKAVNSMQILPFFRKLYSTLIIQIYPHSKHCSHLK